jgi:hypothetical protein
MIDASKFPRVPVVPVADVGRPPPERLESEAVERVKIQLAGGDGVQNDGMAPKAMALQNGRYYVVSEQK